MYQLDELLWSLVVGRRERKSRAQSFEPLLARALHCGSRGLPLCTPESHPVALKTTFTVSITQCGPEMRGKNSRHC